MGLAHKPDGYRFVRPYSKRVTRIVDGRRYEFREHAGLTLYEVNEGRARRVGTLRGNGEQTDPGVRAFLFEGRVPA